MNHRERVQIALNHEEPDRIPIDLGGSCVTSIAKSTYCDLRKYLGLSADNVKIAEMAQQIAVVDYDILEILDADIIPVWANSKYPQIKQLLDGSSGYIDSFGAVMKMPKGGYYYDWSEFPLSEPSLDMLNNMQWPDPEDASLYDGLRERTIKLRSETDYALFGMAPIGHDLFNQLFRVRGMIEGMTDLLLNEDFAEAFFDRLTNTILRCQELFLNEVGDLLDIHFTADDLCGQIGPLVSPAVYRKFIKPRWAKIISMIKSKTKAKIFYHSCGALNEFIPDLIEIGVDILNPVQVTAEGMDTADLKKKYGDKLSFWGGGCDTQKVLCFGSVTDVRDEVTRRIKDLAPNGGFIFNPVHNIQHATPPENIMQMFKTAKELGKYPV